MENELSEDIREMANQYAGAPVKTPEIRLLVRTLLLLANVVDGGFADEVDCAFFLKPYVGIDNVLQFKSVN